MPQSYRRTLRQGLRYGSRLKQTFRVARFATTKADAPASDELVTVEHTSPVRSTILAA